MLLCKIYLPWQIEISPVTKPACKVQCCLTWCYCYSDKGFMCLDLIHWHPPPMCMPFAILLLTNKNNYAVYHNFKRDCKWSLWWWCITTWEECSTTHYWSCVHSSGTTKKLATQGFRIVNTVSKPHFSLCLEIAITMGLHCCECPSSTSCFKLYEYSRK